MTDDERFMHEALAEARMAAAEGEVPIGAVVVCEGEVIARAHNRREGDEDPSAHAEFSAMVAAARKLGRWRLTGCTVYVTLEPCLMCAGLMMNARVDRCVYGAPDPKGGATGTLYQVHRDARLNHAFDVTPGVLGEACAAELQRFFAGLRARRQGPDAGIAVRGDRTGGCEHTSDGSAPAASAGVAAPTHAEAAPAWAHAPQIVLALDSFKGSAASEQAEAWLCEGIARVDPNLRVARIPMADGGEGTLDALRAATGGEVRFARARDAHGVERSVPYLWLSGVDGEGPVAVIEVAQVVGLVQPPEAGERRTAEPPSHQEALEASTAGVGELLAHVVARGARTVAVALGGSCTTDGGIGMLQALGAQILDAQAAPVAAGLNGVRDVARIDLQPACALLRDVRLVALRDVASPLTGPRGAVQMFGPQKGLVAGYPSSGRDAVLAEADGWMRAYGIKLTAARDALDATPWQVAAAGKRPKSLIGVPGAGAAGGLGAALLALGATLVSGAGAVLAAGGFDAGARSASLIVTGEGLLDAQTAEGKVVAGVARRAKAMNPHVRVVAVCGARAEDLTDIYRAGVDVALPIVRRPMALEAALSPVETRENLRCVGEAIARLSHMR